jgi:hypothetical protein
VWLAHISEKDISPVKGNSEVYLRLNWYWKESILRTRIFKNYNVVSAPLQLIKSRTWIGDSKTEDQHILYFSSKKCRTLYFG